MTRLSLDFLRSKVRRRAPLPSKVLPLPSFDGISLQSARHDGVDGGVVPIAIKARDLAGGVVANDVSVGDAVGLAFRYQARDIRGHGAAEQRLYDDDVSFGLDHLV